MEIIAEIIFIVVMVWGGTGALHIIAERVLGSSWVGRRILTSSRLLLLVAVAGCLLVWQRTEYLDPAVKFSVALLYIAGCVVYVECRSLLERGYSLRILVDLIERGGVARIEELKSSYGDGLGVKGILAKRLDSLVEIGLVKFDGLQVGPLTAKGVILAKLGSMVRALLRLGSVG